MDLMKFLAEATAKPGIPGLEGVAASYVKDAFAPLCDQVEIDNMSNVIARIGQKGPRIMVCAHNDEIGLMVRDIEEDGCLRIMRVGGVDQRILPSMEVTVITKDGPLFGVVGAKPPHLLSAADREKQVQFEDLYVDIGYPAEVVREKVRIGDVVVMNAPAIELGNGFAAGKTMDDRACVLAMLVCAEHLKRMNAPAQTCLVASTQEETSSRGAQVSAYSLNPDIAIVLDVTHGDGPGTGKFAPAMNKLAFTAGPNIHPMLLEKLKETARRNHVDFSMEYSGGNTYTDAWATQVVRAGIPSVLISVPLRYMHTTVETLLLDEIREAGRLLALYIDDISREWEDLTWY